MGKGLQFKLVEGICINEELFERLKISDRELVSQQL